MYLQEREEGCLVMQGYVGVLLHVCGNVLWLMNQQTDESSTLDTTAVAFTHSVYVKASVMLSLGWRLVWVEACTESGTKTGRNLLTNYQQLMTCLMQLKQIWLPCGSLAN